MTCRFCLWLCSRLGCDPELEHASFRREIEQWESAHSNDHKLWSEEPDQLRELNAQAAALRESDPDASLRLRIEAADAGSAWAMQSVSVRYHIGAGATADFEQAEKYYRHAISAGSQMATILYARLLAKHGYRERCEQILEDAVQTGFIPAFYWLAWFRLKLSKNSKTAREIAPLVKYAAKEGHPGAEVLLGRLLLSGKLGLSGIPRGLRIFRGFVARQIKANEAEEHVALADMGAVADLVQNRPKA